MRINLPFVLLAVALLSGCVTTGDRVPDNVKASAVNVQLGMGYLQQNNMEQASEKLTKAIRQDPNSASAHNAYGILQERLLQNEKAEEHYQLATELDPTNSAAANNYGTFLCRNKRERESEEYFLQALENPLYNTPEYAYTNAALCLLRIDEKDRAKEYLRKALAARSDFSTALVSMARIEFEEENYSNAKVYLDRFHRVAEPTAKSLWYAIRSELQMDSNRNVDELAEKLKTNFPDSKEYQSWLEIQ